MKVRTRRLTLVMGALVVSASIAACGGSTPPPPVTPPATSVEQVQILPPLAKNNLVVEAGSPNLARLRVDVSGPDLKGIYRFDLPAKDGQVIGGIGIPAGSHRVITLTAFDAQGRGTHHGMSVQNVRDGVNEPFVAELHGEGRGEPIHALVGTYRVQLEGRTIPGKDGDTLRFTAQLLDAAGAPVPVDRREIRWEIDPGGWPTPPKYFPCPPLDSGGGPLCTEFRPPLKFKPEIVACLKDVFCRSVWGSKEYNTVAISAGWLQHACAVKSWGVAYCWGGNGSGQLGATTTSPCLMGNGMGGSVPYACSKSPVPVVCPGGACDFSTITAGASHTCALDKSQDAWCWGLNLEGQLGIGSTGQGGKTPTKVIGGFKFTDISAGRYFTCALSTTQDVYCWGDNSMAAVGSTAGIFIHTPSKVNLIGKFKAISSGGDHACAVDTTGLMYCWGVNNSAQLNGSTSSTGVPSCSNCSAVPQFVQGPSLPSMAGKVVDIPAAGSGFTCAHVTTGQTICWGNIANGQAGSLPATPAIQLLNAGWSHVCFLASGAGSCWGFNNNGQLGNGQFTAINPNAPLSLTPVAVLQPPLGFSKIDGGTAFTCGISASKDDVYCWGINGFGQLGDGTTTASNKPVKIIFP